MVHEVSFQARPGNGDCVMKGPFPLLILLGWAVLIGCGGTGGTGATDLPQADESAVSEPTGFLFGYAQTDITPPIGTVLGGFGAPGGIRKMTGVHDPLLAQVAFFANDAGDAYVMVAVDSAGYFHDFGDWGPGIAAIRRSVSEALAPDLPIEPEHILLASSHSHAATDHAGFWQESGQGSPRQMLDEHLATITEAVVEAYRNLVEADLYFGETVLEGHTGRDKGCSEVIDDTVAIVQARHKGGKTLATIVNYAKHTNLVPESNTLASADFVHGFRKEMRDRTGAPALFLNGFIAAVQDGPLSGSVPGKDFWDRTYQVGSILADTVGGVLDSLQRADTFSIEHRTAVVSCLVKGEYALLLYNLFDLLKRYVLRVDDDLFVESLEVSWHRMGPMEFAVFPGEGTPEYALALKERMVSPGRFAVGLGNDSIGYIVDPESIAKDTTGQLEGYELKMGLGPPAGPCAWEAIQSLGWFDGAWRE